jgi:RNA polymerase sigma-70 factor (ECF subfamily)
MTARHLRDVFLNALSEPLRSDMAESDGLENWLRNSVRTAREAWPELHPPDDDFIRYLASKVQALSTPSSFAKLRGDQLFLAYHCLGGDSRALGLLEERYLPQVGRALGRMKLSSAAIDDIKASLREKLFFAQQGARPLVADYSGRGELGVWLRSIAVHLALKLKKNERKHVEADEHVGSLAAKGNPELDYLRERHAAQFTAALHRALEGLSVRERNLLRQHYLDGLSLDALGELYRVHRATAARWVAGAREAVLQAVRAELLGSMTESELDSFLRMPGEHLGARISQVLRKGS